MTLEQLIGQFIAYTEYPNQDTFVISNAECKQILEYLTAYKDVTDTNVVDIGNEKDKSKKQIPIEEVVKIVHSTMYDYFDCVEDDSEEGISDQDEKLLEINKAICTKIKNSEYVDDDGQYARVLRPLISKRLDEINHLISGCDSPFGYVTVRECQELMNLIRQNLGLGYKNRYR
jgi:hypothetical protein